MQAVLSILLSTFTGFGAAISGSSALVEGLRWRRRRHALRMQNEINNQMTMFNPDPTRVTQIHDVENPETFSGR